MNLDKLKQIAEKLSEESSKGGGNFSGEWPLVTFPPEGKFRGRFITDPTGELYERFMNYGYFAKGIRDPESIDPADLPPHFHNTLAEVSEKLKGHMKFSRGRKTSFLIYFYITDVDNPTDDFKVGNLVCLVGDGRFAQAFSDLMSNLMKDAPEKLLASLSPEHKGPIMEVNIVRGTQGKCTISPTFSEVDPLVVLTEEQKALSSDEKQKIINEVLGKRGYKPLSISYIKPGWDQGKYDALLAAWQEELAEIESKKGAKGGAPADEKKAEDKPDAVQASETKPAETQAVEKVETTTQSDPAVIEGTATEVKEAQPAVTETTSSNPFDKFKRKD